MKYARFIPREDGTTQVIDVLDLAAPPYDQRPLLGCTTDAELLAKLFSPQLIAQWQTANQHFGQVAQDVEDHATYHGGDSLDIANYTNPVSVAPPALAQDSGPSDRDGILIAKANEAEAKGDAVGALLLRSKAGS